MARVVGETSQNEKGNLVGLLPSSQRQAAHSVQLTHPHGSVVEEALCYGWIDSTNKRIDDERLAQRFSPRRKGSPLPPMNQERVRRLIANKKMTRAGLESIAQHLESKTAKTKTLKKIELPQDILDALKQDPTVWKNSSVSRIIQTNSRGLD